MKKGCALSYKKTSGQFGLGLSHKDKTVLTILFLIECYCSADGLFLEEIDEQLHLCRVIGYGESCPDYLCEYTILAKLVRLFTLIQDAGGSERLHFVE